MNQDTVESCPEVVVDLNEKKPIRVLHVDDESNLQKITKQCLEAEGQFQVDNASSVDEAFEKMKKERYDAVVSAYQMPATDGLQFLRKMRKDGNDVPFVIFTGRGKEEIVIEALGLGADYYVSKTGDPKTACCELAHCLRFAVRKHEVEDALKESEERLRWLIKCAPDAIYTNDTNGNFIDGNRQAEILTGFRKEELVGKSILEAGILPKEYAPKVMQDMMNNLQGRRTGPSEYELVRKDGSRVIVEISTFPVIRKGKVEIIGIARDITERKKVEQEKERLLHDLGKRAKELHCLYDVSKLVEESGTSLDDLLHGVADMLPSAWQYPDIACSRIVVGDREFATETFKESGWKQQADIMVQGEKAGFVEVCYLEERPTIAEGPFLKEERGLIDALAERLGKVIERTKAEVKLIESEKKYRNLVELSPDGIVAIDMKGIVTSVNSSLLKLIGSDSEEEIVGKPFTEIARAHVQVQEIPRFAEMFSVLIKGESVPPTEFSYVRRDGTSRWAEAHPGLLMKDGKPLGIQIILRDITERKNAEQSLKESEERFRTVFEGASEGILAADMRNKALVFANPAMCELTGYSLKELIKLSVNDIHPKEELPYVIGEFTKLAEGKKVLANDIPVLRKDNKVVYCELSCRPLRFGKEEYLVGFFRDTTERKKMEETLLASLDRYRTFTEVTGELGWITNADGEAVEDMPSVRKFTGQTYEELKGWGWTKALHPDDLERTTLTWKEATRTKSKYEVEYRMRRHDGVYRYFMARGVPVFKEDGSIREWVGTCIDVTERKKMEEESKESEERLRSIIENSSDQIFLLDRDCRFLALNKVAADLFGKSPQELVGTSIFEVFPEATAAKFSKNVKNVFDTGKTMFIDEKMFVEGRELYNSTSLNPVRDDRGRVTAVTGIVRDITGMKKTEEELKRSLDKLEMMNEKLHVVGSLTRHDVRNKLSVVPGYSYLLKKKHADELDVVEDLGIMEQAVKEVERIFEFARMYEQLGVEELVYLDVEKTVAEAEALCSGLTFKVANDCRGLTLLADSFLRQLIYNFIDNTRKYGKKTTIVRVHYEKADDGDLRLVFEDDGVGISFEDKQQLFKQGFSTGGSTGFGLFFSKKMMEVYGWAIQETGEPGKGARFVMTIPKVNKAGQVNFKIQSSV